MPEKVSRRRFLKIGGAALLSVAAVGGVGGFIATRTPEVEMVDKELTGTQPGKKMLVAYATRAGSTIAVAEAVAGELANTGAAVDICPASAVLDVSEYDAVVVGSAIRIGAWLPEAAELVQRNQQALASIPTAYFTVSGYLRKDTPEMRQVVGAYTDPICEMVEPVSVGLFAGKIDYETLSLLDRTMAQTMGEVEGDWRNWSEIKGWAREIAPKLVQTS